MSSILSDRRTAVLAAVLAILAVSFGVVRFSAAAFTAQTSTGANNWASGSVTIGSDGQGELIFNAADIVPGHSDEVCVVVEYTGSLDADIGLFVTPEGVNQDLAAYLELTVDGAPGDHGTDGDCDGTFAGAVDESYASGDALSGVYVSSGSYANAFSPYWEYRDGGGRFRTYRIVVELPSDASNDAQDATASARFTWEARNV